MGGSSSGNARLRMRAERGEARGLLAHRIAVTAAAAMAERRRSTARACGVQRAARTGLLSLLDVVPLLMSCTMLKVVPSKDQSSNPWTPSKAFKYSLSLNSV